MSTRLAAVLAAALTIGLAGCDLAAPPAGSDLDGTWRLTGGVHDGAPVPVLDEAPITMTIDATEVGGRAACNQYGGDVRVDGDRVAFGAMSMTEMGCDPAVMDAESAYLAALGDVERWTRDGGMLTLSGEAVELTFELVPPTPTADLVRTTWRLDGLIDGDAVSSTMGEEPATLELREDGTISGTTGCRGFDGRYELEAGAVQVTDLVTDDRACPDLASQDEHVLAVVGDGFAYAIDADRLTLTAGRLGLIYLADEG